MNGIDMSNKVFRIYKRYATGYTIYINGKPTEGLVYKRHCRLVKIKEAELIMLNK